VEPTQQRNKTRESESATGQGLRALGTQADQAGPHVGARALCRWAAQERRVSGPNWRQMAQLGFYSFSFLFFCFLFFPKFMFFKF
jgi:hypothetical protein